MPPRKGQQETEQHAGGLNYPFLPPKAAFPATFAAMAKLIYTHIDRHCI